YPLPQCRDRLDARHQAGSNSKLRLIAHRGQSNDKSSMSQVIGQVDVRNSVDARKIFTRCATGRRFDKAMRRFVEWLSNRGDGEISRGAEDDQALGTCRRTCRTLSAFRADGPPESSARFLPRHG